MERTLIIRRLTPPANVDLARIRRDLTNGVLGSKWVPRHHRWRLLRWWGLDAQPCVIAPGCFFGGTDMHVGRDAYLGYECFFDLSAPISIGQECRLGMQCMLVTGTHEVGPANRRAGESSVLPVTVEAGAWLGARVTVMPGVTIGRGSIVAAGAVVVDDIPANTLAAGVPARVVRKL